MMLALEMIVSPCEPHLFLMCYAAAIGAIFSATDSVCTLQVGLREYSYDPHSKHFHDTFSV